MKIACYCQHVLGIGHFHRSLEICKALAVHHETVMILGGPDVSLPETDVRFLQLPGLRMDENFSKLIPCDSGMELEAVKAERKHALFDFFTNFQPDVFLVELYPFGRKAFRFELDPILNGISTAELAPCLRLCSLRDILVEKTDQDKYESRILNILNNSFDGLLVHSDPEFIPLEQTFGATDSITIPTKYTGFITPVQESSPPDNSFRLGLQLSTEDKLVVASIGGGNVGAELLQATAAAAQLLQEKKHIHFHLFTGPYSAPELHAELEKYKNPRLHIHNFCNNFPEWLQAADLSISMAGYNTCMNLLGAGIPALLYPFAQNREQRMRVSAFRECSGFTLLEIDDLLPASLAEQIMVKLTQQKQVNRVDLQGAIKSCDLISDPNIWKKKNL